LGHPSKIPAVSRLGFVTAATSLTRGQPNFARRLAVSWASTLYIHFASKSCLLYWQRYCTALQQRASAKLCGVVQGMELRSFRRGRHLYLAGRPSRWASAYIMVTFVVVIMAALWYKKAIIFLPCGFYLLSSSFFPRLISAAADWMSTILPHMVWP